MPKRFRKQLYDFMTIASNDANGDIWVYGDIVDDKWYDNDVTPVTIRDTLNEMGPVNILNLRVNSYGGSCMAGNAIVNLIDNYKRKTGARVDGYNDGMAASMASGILMAADYIYMAENAMFMIHKPYSIAVGNSFDMEHEAEVLEKVEDTLVSNYMRHFNGTEDELRQLMADESWLTAEEALEYGFCDEIVPAVAVAASAKGICINGCSFRGNPLKEHFKENEIEGEKKMNKQNHVVPETTVNSIATITDSTGAVTSISTSCPVSTSSNINTETVQSHIEFISANKAKEMLGKDMTADEILSFAKAGMEMDTEADAKAKAYDKLINTAMEDALKSGIRAKGDGFNDTKWRKILASLNYEEIMDQKNEWEAEAKLALKAGKRVSQNWTQDPAPENNAVNIDDFKI